MAAGRWRRFVLRPFVWLLVASALAVLGLQLLLGSSFARERVRGLIAARISDALSRPVTIAAVDFELLPARLVVEGLVIGADRAGEPPLARLARGEVTASAGGIRLPSVELDRVELSGLEIQLVFRADGSDNLPRPRRSGGRRLSIRVGGLAIDDGVLLLEEERLPFSLAARTVLARLAGVEDEVLDGTAVAQAVVLRLPGAEPLEVAVAARLRLDRERLSVLNARVDAPGLAARARGAIAWRRGPEVDLETRVETSAAVLDRLGWAPGLFAGSAVFDGRFDYRDRRWALGGRVGSGQLGVVGFDLRDLEATVEAGADGVLVAVERARWGGGDLAGRLTIGIRRPYPADLDLRLDGAAIDAVLERFEVPARGVRGRLSGPFRYRFDLADARRGDGEGRFAVSGAQTGSGAPPAEGEVTVRLGEGRVELDPMRWRVGGQRAAGRAAFDLVSGRGRVDLTIRSEDLGRLARLLPFLGADDLWTPTAGTGEAVLGLEIAAGGFAATVDLACAALETAGVRAVRGAGRLRATSQRLVIESLDLAHADGGSMRLAGEVPLEADGALALRLVADGWPVEEAQPWLPFDLPLTGSARGELVLAGTVERMRGDAELVVAPATLAGVAANRLAARLDWDPERAILSGLRVDLDAGGIEATGRLDLDDERLEVDFSSPALALDAAPLSFVGRGALQGSLRVAGRLSGRLSEPELEIAASAPDVTLAGRALPGGRGLEARIDWRRSELAATVDLPEVARLSGGGPLVLGADSRLRFELESRSLADLVTLGAGSELLAFDGGLRAQVLVELPAGGGPAVDLVAESVGFRWQDRPVRSVEPVRVSYRDGQLRVRSLYLALGEGGDELFVGGRIDFEERPQLGLHVQADLAASWLSPWLDGIDLTGRVAFLANLRGSADDLRWSGQGEWSAGRWVPPVVPHTLERARALVLLYPNSVVLDQLTGDFAGGQLTGSGRVDLSDGGVSYRFEAAARDLSLRWPTGWRLHGDADLTLTSTRDGRQLAGLVNLERAFYLQDLELSPAQLVQRLLARARVVVPETDELLRSTGLNVAVTAPASLRVRNNVAELTASADLAVRGSAAQPVLFGEVRVEPDGEVSYGGNDYEVERGVLTFANPERIDPFLDLVAETRINDYAVTLTVGGVLSRPQTSFRSDPPLPDLEILGLLTTGAPPSSPLLTDVARSDEERSRSGAAEALLYGQAASLVSNRVGRLFGFDRIRVEPLTTEDTVASARVTVGKRLSSRLFVTYSYDPSSTAQDIYQVEWRLSDDLVLVMTQNGDESYAVDARWEARF